jgi:hypothetical protein
LVAHAPGVAFDGIVVAGLVTLPGHGGAGRRRGARPAGAATGAGGDVLAMRGRWDTRRDAARSLGATGVTASGDAVTLVWSPARLAAG